ncbi:MAG: bifunctional oligoribonuclease/PAP phosphatase NrnA [bacterium]|nr:bifunctional oligoribonuclease/PAP phosphatase NrnA [bacterium]
MASVKEIADFLKTHDNYLISGHVFPDGDNIGSALALSEMVSSLGKKSAVYIEGPVPKIHQWMPGAEIINTDLHSALSDVGNPVLNPTLLIVDSSDASRMGADYLEWFEKQHNLEIINIDHHVSNVNFGTVNLVDPRYSSVGEILFELVPELGLELTKSIATNIFVSMYTDTGRFSFSNTSARTLRYAGECVKAGAKPNVAFRNLYGSRSMESFHLQQESFKTLTSFLDGEGFYFYVDLKMLDETGTTLQDTEGLIDVVRTLEGFTIVVFFKEVAEDDVRISTRAHRPINANKLMSLFGGGGHPRAAGCRIHLPLREAIDHFVKVAEESIRSGESLEDDKRPTVNNTDPFH